MTTTAKIDVINQDLLESIREFFRSVLRLENISAILVPLELPMKNMVMPALVSDPEKLKDADPLAPVFPLNAARIAARLTRKPAGGKIVAVLRPCEIRAFIELVKLKQGRIDEIILVGLDCLGAYQNRDYLKLARENVNEFTLKFYRDALSQNEVKTDEIELAAACRACKHPVSNNADILIGLLGMNVNDHILAESRSPAGEELISRLDLESIEPPGSRKEAVESLKAKRIAFREQMFEQTSEIVNSIEKMNRYFASCVNCYNCRVACPVCYCRECVFVTDVFNHDPVQYLKWSQRKGSIKMPAETIFYHLTRLAHMSTACVGCGQCSNACPNDIPVAEIFCTVARKTQEAFDYEAGQSLEDEPPMSVFREDEFNEVVGIGPM